MSLFLPPTNFPQNLSHWFNISWREELIYQAKERDEKMEKTRQSWLEAGSSKHICKSQRGQPKSIAQSPALETHSHKAKKGISVHIISISSDRTSDRIATAVFLQFHF